MKKLLYTIVIIITGFACSDLDIKPDGINTAKNLFGTERDAVAAVNAVYASLQTHDIYNQFMEVVQSQGTDDAEWGFGRNTSNINKLQMDKFQFDASSDLAYRFWENHYKNINRANIVLDKVAEMNIGKEIKARFLGEGRFIRSLMYFNLIRLFGDVPLITRPTVTLEGLNVRRTSMDSVYNQIVEDLIFCKNNLPLQYPSSDYGRPTKGAAMGMLVKVYLTQREYQKAADEAEDVMSLGAYSLWPTYKEVFKIENENIGESIFEIQFKSTGGTDASVSSSYQGFFKPSATVLPPAPGEFAGFGDNPVTKNHYEIYAQGDHRKDVNVLYVPSAPSSVRYPYYVNKYQDLNATTVSDGGNNYYILRYADILLMYAEALNEVSPANISAYEAFNQVRRRSFGLPVNASSSVDLAAGLSKEQFLDSIMLERRKEFAFEGQRRFDLLRWDKLKESMILQDPSILVEERHKLFPIPAKELIVNTLLDQNDGY